MLPSSCAALTYRIIPNTSVAVCYRNLSLGVPLRSTVAGNFRKTRDKTRPLTYEMAMRPTMFGVRKAWLTWHTQNLEEFRQMQPHVILQDEAIRRFITGFFPDNIIRDGEELIIKRRGNVVFVTGFLKLFNYDKTRQANNKRRIYWMWGFAEEFLTILLKQPVKLELQFIFKEDELTYKYI